LLAERSRRKAEGSPGLTNLHIYPIKGVRRSAESMQAFRTRTRRAASMVTVLLASALMAIVGAGMMRLMSGFNREVASLGQRGDVLDVRNTLRRRLNFQRTFPAGTCAAGTNGLVTLRDDQGNDVFPDVVAEPAPFGTSFRFATARIQTRCGAGALDIFVANGRRPETAWPTVPTVSTCPEVLGGTFTHSCSSGEVMRGINPVTFEPLCTSSGTPDCPFGQVMRGWNVDTGSPNGIPIAPRRRSAPSHRPSCNRPAASRPERKSTSFPSRLHRPTPSARNRRTATRTPG
jgi:hypothetical protein